MRTGSVVEQFCRRWFWDMLLAFLLSLEIASVQHSVDVHYVQNCLIQSM